MSYICQNEIHCTLGGVGARKIAEFLEAQHGPYPDGDASWKEVINRRRTDWKDRDGHLREISLNWPDAVFALDVLGEDGLDVSREYHRNGQCYTVWAKIPEFNPAMLGPDEPGESQPGESQTGEDRWDPAESIYQGLRAQNLLNEALWDLNDGVGNCYPDDEGVDRLAPSLKDTVMKVIRMSNTTSCPDGYHDLANLAHDVVTNLPESEQNALREAISGPRA